MSCSNLSSCSITASDCFLELNGSSGIVDVIIASAVGSTLTLSRKVQVCIGCTCIAKCAVITGAEMQLESKAGMKVYSATEFFNSF